MANKSDFYKSFEDRYRGSRDDIKKRLSIYEPFLNLISTNDLKKGLDIGCGRGEWLEILRNASIKSVGIDLDSEMLSDCRSRNLDVVEGDGLKYLEETEDNSLAIISAFHVIEHIEFIDIFSLLTNAYKSLIPSGLIIIETPNPENIVTATNNFHLDPSHNNPIPPLLLSFLAEFIGFESVKIIRLQDNINDVHNIYLRDVLAGVSQDYALIAQKKPLDRNNNGILHEVFSESIGYDLNYLMEKYINKEKEMEIKIKNIEEDMSIISSDINSIKNNLFIKLYNWSLLKMKKIIG